MARADQRGEVGEGRLVQLNNVMAPRRSLEVTHHVVSVPLPEDEGIRPQPAVEKVIPLTAFDGLIAGATKDGVPAPIAMQHAAAIAADDVVIAVPAGDPVLAAPAGQRVIAGTAGDLVVAVAAGDAVMAGPAGKGVLPPAAEQAAYKAVLKEINGRPQIWGKLSDMENRTIPARGLAQLKDRLDVLMDCFGQDRVVFGTNWPETWGVATPAQIVTLAREYFATRSRAEAEKFFWKNSLRFYKWKKRALNQPSLT